MPVYTTWWRNKFLRSANTLDQLIEVFDESAQELREMKTAGVELDWQGDDYYLLSTEDAEVAKKFGMTKDDGWEE